MQMKMKVMFPGNANASKLIAVCARTFGTVHQDAYGGGHAPLSCIYKLK